ncbi:MAG: nucleotide pyrophosphohydrolase [Planctomycetota bacterium]|nr:MAG: nucleotide pyrophosphohydrolase [Planctomycetota bacterium]
MSTDQDTTVAELRQLIADFIRERDWEQFHDPKNLAMAIGTEAAELMEHFRWVKNDESRDMACDPEVKAKAGEELADILAFVLSFANTAGIDITTSLKAKMAKNDKKYPADQYKGRY